MRKLVLEEKKTEKESKKSASEKKEIMWNVVNSLLAGSLVLLGGLSTGEITLKTLCFACIAAGIVAITRFQEYWKKEEAEYSNKLLVFKFF